MMILMLLFRKKCRIPVSISLLTVIHDNIDASILESVKIFFEYFR